MYLLSRRGSDVRSTPEAPLHGGGVLTNLLSELVGTGPQDALLVIEVAETSADYDREIKMALYARAGVPEAWLVDLQEGVVEVRRSPSPDGYRGVQQHRPGQHLSPEAFPGLSLAVDAVLG